MCSIYIYPLKVIFILPQTKNPFLKPVIFNLFRCLFTVDNIYAKLLFYHFNGDHYRLKILFLVSVNKRL